MTNADRIQRVLHGAVSVVKCAIQSGNVSVSRGMCISIRLHLGELDRTFLTFIHCEPQEAQAMGCHIRVSWWYNISWTFAESTRLQGSLLLGPGLRPGAVLKCRPFFFFFSFRLPILHCERWLVRSLVIRHSRSREDKFCLPRVPLRAREPVRRLRSWAVIYLFPCHVCFCSQSISRWGTFLKKC